MEIHSNSAYAQAQAQDDVPEYVKVIILSGDFSRKLYDCEDATLVASNGEELDIVLNSVEFIPSLRVTKVWYS